MYMDMEKNINNSTLASYAVMKYLADDKEYKNSYEIMADFIRYIIVDKNLHSFSVIDIESYLRNEFGFDSIPEQAIRTSLNQISECSKSENEYTISNNIAYETDAFKRVKAASDEHSQDVTKKLFEFAMQISSDSVWLEKLEASFIKYLLDDSATIDHEYSDVISKFILSVDGDRKIKEKIEDIREGSILYTGLAYNISELGSINSDLTLFLDTEILFNIAGYNGELYKKMADDFLDQVRLANSKHKRIKLKYFKEVENEVSGFFTAAENTLRGRGEFVLSTAMRSILNGCSSVSDVIDKEADFFHKLQYQYGIVPDEKASYYNEDDIEYNDESIPAGFPKDEKSYEAVKFINYIYKLRKGQQYAEYTKCKYLLITETRRIQEISNSEKEAPSVCGYAVPMSFITNLLWYKLGSGFSKSVYPINTDVVYKAKRILSGELFSNITRFYTDTKKKFKDGEISQESLVNRIVLLRDKSRYPDELNNDNVDELLDFSQEYINHYEESIKYNEVRSAEQQKLIKDLKEKHKVSEEKNDELLNELNRAKEERNKSIAINKDQESKIIEQQKELDVYHKKEEKQEKIKKKAKQIILFLIRLMITAAIIIAIVLGLNKLFSSLSPSISATVNIIVDIGGIIAFIWSIIKYHWKKSFQSEEL